MTIKLLVVSIMIAAFTVISFAQEEVWFGKGKKDYDYCFQEKKTPENAGRG